MKCPLLSIACGASQLPIAELTDNCLKEACAWWDPSLTLCSVRTIAGKLDDIDTVLGHLDSKIPLGGAK